MYKIIWLFKLRPRIPNTKFGYFIKFIGAIINLDNIMTEDITGNIVVLARIIDMMLF